MTTLTERPAAPARLARAERTLARVAVPALRISLGVVFVWFGALKVLGDSPVAALLHATVPWVPPGFLVPALGWVEVVIGLALLAAAVHLTGTFLTFLEAPALMVSRGDPLLLTADGEFVCKNLVLICAALVLLNRPARD